MVKSICFSIRIIKLFKVNTTKGFYIAGLSLPATPEHVQKTRLSEEPLDYNSNNEDQLKLEDKGLDKDFQDIRKHTSNGVSKICTDDTESPVVEIKTNDKHVVTENNLSVENSHKDENVACNSSEIGENDETNLFQDVNNVFNTLRQDKTDLCNTENNLNGVDSESKALEALKIDDCNTTEILDVRKTSTENVDDCYVDFENQEKFDIDLKENVHTNDQVADDDFGGFKDYIESKDEGKPSVSGDFDDFKNNTNSALHSDYHEDFCAFEKLSGNAETQKPNCDVDDDFGDFSAAVDSSNSWKTTLANDESGDLEKNPSNVSEKVTDDFDNFGDFEKCTTKSDDTDDFGDFEGSTVPVESATAVSLETRKDDEDDFGNFQSTKDDDGFGDFENFPVQTNKPKDDFGDFEKRSVQAEEDDFGDFDSCSTTDNFKTDDVFSEKKAEEVITSAFPKVDVEEEEYLHTDIPENDKVFNLVKDIMETNALKFQWANSSSQKVLLKALNIDIRNIVSFVFNCELNFYCKSYF